MKKIRRRTLGAKLLVFAGIFSSEAAAQETVTKTNEVAGVRPSHISLGFALSSLSSDFGMGARLTSPFFAGKNVALRLQGGIHWKEGWFSSSPPMT